MGYISNSCFYHNYLLDHYQPKNTQRLVTVQSYFGRRVSVLFDDGRWYEGIIITGKDPKTQLWVTQFKDGTEEFTKDPQNDKDHKLFD